jgi:hypothetical protein
MLIKKKTKKIHSKPSKQIKHYDMDNVNEKIK